MTPAFASDEAFAFVLLKAGGIVVHAHKFPIGKEYAFFPTVWVSQSQHSAKGLFQQGYGEAPTRGRFPRRPPGPRASGPPQPARKGPQRLVSRVSSPGAALRTGTDCLATHPTLGAELRSTRVGLLAHAASVDRRLVHARRIDALGVRVALLLLGPEHGYGGEAQDLIGVADARDALWNADRQPLRRAFRGPLSPRAQRTSQAIDVLVIDLQDVGSRYYTFVWTAVLAMRACARCGRSNRSPAIDRILLGGDVARIEGQAARGEKTALVRGLEPVPVRHSLTLGEIVAWRAQVEGVPLEAGARPRRCGARAR